MARIYMMKQNKKPTLDLLAAAKYEKGDKEVRRLVTVQEMAEILRVPRSWLYERTRLNQIPHLKLGRYVRFEPEQVISYFKEKQKFERGGPSSYSGGKAKRPPMAK